MIGNLLMSLDRFGIIDGERFVDALQLLSLRCGKANETAVRQHEQVLDLDPHSISYQRELREIFIEPRCTISVCSSAQLGTITTINR